MIVGAYQPRDSLLHRIGAGPKLTLIAALSVVLVLCSSPSVCGAVVVAAIAGIRLARLPFGMLARTLRPFAVLLGVLVVLQLALGRPSAAVTVALRLTALLLLAILYNATTRVSATVACFTKLLRLARPLGVNPEAAGLMIGLSMTSLPLATREMTLIKEAHAARGGRGPGIRIVSVFLVRILRIGATMADALEARGYPGQPQARARPPRTLP